MATHFIGECIGKLDDKGRLIFPAEFRAQAAADEICFVVKKHVFNQCLVLCSLQEWERQAEAIKAKLNPFNREHNQFWSDYTRDRAEVQPDEKNGRILIPRYLLDMIGVTKEVVFVAEDHQIVIWAKELRPGRTAEDAIAAAAEKILG